MAKMYADKEKTTSQKKIAKQRKKEAKKEARFMLRIELIRKDVHKAEQRASKAQENLHVQQSALQELEQRLTQLRQNDKNSSQSTGDKHNTVVQTSADQQPENAGSAYGKSDVDAPQSEAASQIDADALATASTSSAVTEYADGEIHIHDDITNANQTAVTEFADGEIITSSPLSAETSQVTVFADGEVQVAPPITATAPTITEFADGELQTSSPENENDQDAKSKAQEVSIDQALEPPVDSENGHHTEVPEDDNEDSTEDSAEEPVSTRTTRTRRTSTRRNTRKNEGSTDAQ